MDSKIEGDYRLITKVGEGTYGTVFKAVQISTGDQVAIKKVKIRKPDDGIPKELMREVESNECLPEDAEYLVRVSEVHLGKTNVNIVYRPYCKQGDLGDFFTRANKGEIQMTLDTAYFLACHLIKALAQLHFQDCESTFLVHRDLKPSNILLNHSIFGEAKYVCPDFGPVVICDFGQCRVDINSMNQSSDRQEETRYTLEVGSRWYKAPELLMGSRQYSQSLDVWSIGCVLAEAFALAVHPRLHNPLAPLFQGQSDIDQMVRICAALGDPSPENWKGVETMPDYGKILFKPKQPVPASKFILDELGVSEEAFSGSEKEKEQMSVMRELIDSMLRLCPEERPSALDLTKHFEI